jgi:hypothetical protein
MCANGHHAVRRTFARSEIESPQARAGRLKPVDGGRFDQRAEPSARPMRDLGEIAIQCSSSSRIALPSEPYDCLGAEGEIEYARAELNGLRLSCALRRK